MVTFMQNKGILLLLTGIILGTILGYSIKKEKTEVYTIKATANLSEPDMLTAEADTTITEKDGVYYFEADIKGNSNVIFTDSPTNIKIQPRLDDTTRYYLSEDKYYYTYDYPGGELTFSVHLSFTSKDLNVSEDRLAKLKDYVNNQGFCIITYDFFTEANTIFRVMNVILD